MFILTQESQPVMCLHRVTKMGMFILWWLSQPVMFLHREPIWAGLTLVQPVGLVPTERVNWACSSSHRFS